MNEWAQLQHWLMQDHCRMQLLRRAAALNLPDWCLAAGFVRNLVWDRQAGFTRPTALNDIDLVYFDADNGSAARDRVLEQTLIAADGYPWSVKNQARMHRRSGREPYRDTEDAISYWVERETAVGVRLNRSGQLELVAPLGLSSLLAGCLSHNSRHGQRADFEARVASKGWLQRWPHLQLQP